MMQCPSVDKLACGEDWQVDDIEDSSSDEEECSALSATPTPLQPSTATHLKQTLPKSRYKHVPHCEKPPQVVEKRNARERKRVQTVNSAFVKLRKYIPYENRHKRLSKVKTLRKAIEYIEHLQGLLHDYKQQDLLLPVGPGAGTGGYGHPPAPLSPPRLAPGCEGGPLLSGHTASSLGMLLGATDREDPTHLHTDYLYTKTTEHLSQVLQSPAELYMDASINKACGEPGHPGTISGGLPALHPDIPAPMVPAFLTPLLQNLPPTS